MQKNSKPLPQQGPFRGYQPKPNPKPQGGNQPTTITGAPAKLPNAGPGGKKPQK